MLNAISGLIHYSLLLYFGVYISFVFVGIPLHQKNRWILLSFCTLSILLQWTLFSNYGFETIRRLYPFVVHFPLILLIFFYYQQDFISSTFSVLTAYLCCSLSSWVGTLVLAMTSKQWLAYWVRSISLIIISVLIIRYIAYSIVVIQTKPRKTVLIFYIVPVTYYLYDYTTKIFTNWLFSGSLLAFEFLPFILSLSYLLFCVVYLKEYEEKCHIERYNQLMDIQTIQSRKEIERITQSTNEIVRLRHDMRHFLQTVITNLKNGDVDKATLSIIEIINAIDVTANQKFCDNHTVNSILCYFHQRMIDNNIQLKIKANLPTELSISMMDFTSILANGLENAFNAVSPLEPSQRSITVSITMKEDKLLLMIQNPCFQYIPFEKGLPLSQRKKHGIGTQSIQCITKKMNGNCQFTLDNNQFTLRVVLSV